MHVFRIETKDGKGICAATGSDLCTIYREAGGKEIEHCSLCDCELRKARAMGSGNRSFAFPSIEAIKTWFSSRKGRKAMKDAGAIGHVFESENIAKSSYQCVFEKKTAKRIGSFDLETLQITLS